MRNRLLGNTRLAVSELGLGCMPMSEFYGPANVAGFTKSVQLAIDLGVTYFDTAASYGAPQHGESANEVVLGDALENRRDEIVLATKFGVVRQGNRLVANNSREHILGSIDDSLRRLKTDHIDLYYLHRHDRRIPIEEVVGTMTELVTAGKVRYLGLSEVDPATLRRACAVYPITALQSEYSLISRHLESGTIAAARELGVGLVAYSPLSRALLSQRPPEWHLLSPGDLRRSLPRFRSPNLQHNLGLVDRVNKIAAEVGCTTAQLALAWLLSKGQDIVPIPSSTRPEHLRENVEATEFSLTDEQVRLLDHAIRPEDIEGERNTPAALALMAH
ncbi:aldo/keto reductase [Catelliglobosispora koreensis]|uniref:aldo/keto reductase n=1 Tax=Catelliglobosispora koreensis TaxID=129052 RepID=UPI00036EE9DF|nr:aldo/keto reductase [Catelliglobosispora koreensis]